MNPSTLANALSNHLVRSIQQYEEDHQCKILGAGFSKHVIDLSPNLPSRLWAELDILPFSFDRGLKSTLAKKLQTGLTVDEEADSMARKCLMYVWVS
jgi:alpha,alpha-trehalose phosphorylase (configuration-retaining)